MKIYLWNTATPNTLDDAHGWGLEDFAQPNATVALSAEAAKRAALEDFILQLDEDDAEDEVVRAEVSLGYLTWTDHEDGDKYVIKRNEEVLCMLCIREVRINRD